MIWVFIQYFFQIRFCSFQIISIKTHLCIAKHCIFILRISFQSFSVAVFCQFIFFCKNIFLSFLNIYSRIIWIYGKYFIGTFIESRFISHCMFRECNKFKCINIIRFHCKNVMCNFHSFFILTVRIVKRTQNEFQFQIIIQFFREVIKMIDCSF